MGTFVTYLIECPGYLNQRKITPQIVLLTLSLLVPFLPIMAARCSSSDYQSLISNLKAAGIIRSARVEKAMLSVDRAHYCKRSPYEDHPQSIGFMVTISAPHMHAYALELLQDRLYEGASALDVGSGSGYLTACMGMMVGPKGKVVGIDHIPELVQMSIQNMNKSNSDLLESGCVKLIGTIIRESILNNPLMILSSSSGRRSKRLCRGSSL